MILVFGATGMLGRYMVIYLKRYMTVKGIDRQIYDIETGTVDQLDQIFNANQSDLIVINCAGVIPQRVTADNRNTYVKVNTVFPHLLYDMCRRYNAQLIHITTDCVFSGRTGHYTEQSAHDETSLYGVTKSLGEPPGACVIRTSIIGEELFNKRSLLEWVVSNKGGVINGYTNHWWNGVTCLALSTIVKDMIEHRTFWCGVRHIYSPTVVSKYQLCEYINNIYQLHITIIPINDGNYVNKTLSSIYQPVFQIPDIESQIVIQKNFSIEQ